MDIFRGVLATIGTMTVSLVVIVALAVGWHAWLKPRFRAFLQRWADSLAPDPYEGREYARPKENKSGADNSIETEET